MAAREPERVAAGIEAGIAELLACGTTHVGDISASGLSIEPLLESGLHGIVWMEVLGRDWNYAQERLAQVKTTIQHARAHPSYGRIQAGLSIHAPYTCHPELVRAGVAWCCTEDIPLCIHLAESPAETELLLYGRGPIATWQAEIAAQGGPDPLPIPRLRPVQHLEALGALEARPLLVHAIQVTDEDIRTIADAGCAVVHCPRSNALLQCGRMPLERYLEAGVTVYLGTDSRASCPSLNIHDEIAFAQHLHTGHVAPEIIAALAQKPLIAQ